MKPITRSAIFNIKNVQLHYMKGDGKLRHFRITTNDGIEMSLLPKNVDEHFKIFEVWWAFQSMYGIDKMILR